MNCTCRSTSNVAIFTWASPQKRVSVPTDDHVEIFHLKSFQWLKVKTFWEEIEITSKI